MPSASASPSPRDSLPNILHQSTAKAAPSQPALSPHHDNANVLTPSDDIFSNLSTFTFGAARPPAQRTDSAISPFTVATANGGDTPWQSIPTSNRTTRARSTLRIGSRHVHGGLRSDEDEEEAARQNRAKMCAIDDGIRRPSLATNVYSGPLESPSSPRVDTDSEVEPDSATAYDDDGEELDMDVEFDYRNPSHEDISDAASLHTFSGGDKGYYAPGPTRDERRSRLSFAASYMLQNLNEYQEGDEDLDQVDAGASSPVTSAEQSQ